MANYTKSYTTGASEIVAGSFWPHKYLSGDLGGKESIEDYVEKKYFNNV
jgi:hypothetical protein